jgi:hypothetical protein
MKRASTTVHNPLLALPAAQQLLAQPEEARRLQAALYRDLATQAAALADSSWRKHKGIMAAYWKGVAVYAKHTARALNHPARKQRGSAA